MSIDLDSFFKKDFLGKEDIRELKTTPEGRQALMAYIMRERIAYGVGKVLIDLGLPLPDKQTQEKVVWTIWRYAMGEKPVWELMDEGEKAKGVLQNQALTADVGAFVNLDDVRGNA
jgi:hypothetical protein